MKTMRRILSRSIAALLMCGGHAWVPAASAQTTTSSLSAGGAHVCHLGGDRTVQCLGDNYFGQLGIGNFTDQSKLVKISTLADVKQVAAGRYHTCAVQTNGNVSCWGDNYFGQLGNGNTAIQNRPVSVSGLSNVLVVAAGNSFSCALKSDGYVACWGLAFGKPLELGDNFQASDLESLVNAQPKNLTPVKISGLENVVAIAAGALHLCALKKDTTVACVGYNSGGELGLGNFESQSSPAIVPGLSQVVKLTAGFAHTCAITQDGSAWCWGTNSSGQLGVTLKRTCAPFASKEECAMLDKMSDKLPPITDSGSINVPTQVYRLKDVVDITAGGFHTCALSKTGALSCWGENRYGQLGFLGAINPTQPVLPNGGYTANQYLPATVSAVSDVVNIAAGLNNTCVLHSDDSFDCYGKMTKIRDLFPDE